MRGPADPVDKSVAPEGEVAEVPENPTEIEVNNRTGNTVGLLLKWDSAAWIWADVDSYIELNTSSL